MLEKIKKYLWLIILIIILLISGYFVYKYFIKNANKTDTEVALETYFDSENKAGDFTYEKTDQNEEGRYWVDGRKFKIEFTQEDGYHRWLISPDGENVYYCYDETEECVIGVVSVDNYMLRWYKPSKDMENLGMDTENECEKVKYTVDKLYDIEGASNAYYVDYVLYCVKDGDLVYRDHSGHAVVEGEEEDESTVSRFYLGDVDLKASFKDVSFEIIYDIREE
jgi:hypothetical protein